MNNFIKIKNLNKKYEKNKTIRVLNDISFNFESGKVYSIMGPSGSGKSTLLNLISLIDTPSSGILKMNNLKIDYNNQSNNDDIRSKNIGIIYQDKNLLSDFTALENVYLARITSGIDKKKALDQSINILKKVGLSNRLNHFTSDLSGGESQRVAISRALINTPKIILADEPTGSLDHQTSKDIFRLLFRQKNKDRIIIYATHNRYFANMADCKISLVDGKIKSGNARF